MTPASLFRLIAATFALCAMTADRSTFANEGRSQSWMDDVALTATFAGKTIQGHYASGQPFTETYFAHGGIDYVERTRQFGGHWSVQGRTFCTIYHRHSTGGCYLVSQISENCFEFYYVARTEQDAANNLTIPPAWTARAAVSDRSGTCEERPVA